MVDNDQQFCLRWNNHQSTLISVFDTLLENGVLVDCTLAAEGKYLKAHKVVLTACSPYFETLLTQQFDKHPILILKDIKFQELKAMMDYMYRGEVNISQDQLSALLRAAESLQIKGLSDSHVFNDNDSVPHQQSSTSSSQHHHHHHSHQHSHNQHHQQPQQQQRSHGLTIENKRTSSMMLNNSNNNSALMNRNDFSVESSVSRESSQSPTARKRRKTRPMTKQTIHNNNNMVLEEQQGGSLNQNSSNDDRVGSLTASTTATSNIPTVTTVTVTTSSISINPATAITNTSLVALASSSSSTTTTTTTTTNIPLGLTKTTSININQDKDNDPILSTMTTNGSHTTTNTTSNLVNRPLPQLQHVPLSSATVTAVAATTPVPTTQTTGTPIASVATSNQISKSASFAAVPVTITVTETSDSYDNHSRKSMSPENEGLVVPKFECYDEGEGEGNDDDAPNTSNEDFDDDDEYEGYDNKPSTSYQDGSYQGYSGWPNMEDGFQSGQDSSALPNREVQVFKHKCDYCNRKFAKKHFMNLHMKRHNIDIEGLDEQRFRSLLDEVLPKGIKFPINNAVDFDRFDNFLSNQKHLNDIASKLVHFEDELNDFLLFACKRLLNGDYAGYICSKGKDDKEKFIRSNVILLLHHTAKMSTKMQNASLRDVRGYVMIWLRNCRKTLLIRLQKQETQEMQMQSLKVDDLFHKS